MIRTNALIATITLAVALLAATGVLVAGPLNPPPGPVSSTYKTLTEVEPRIAISATNTPGDATSLYRITQPGSYYLTGNITGVAGKVGIRIDSSRVSLDLCGFSVIGVPGATSGIVSYGYSNVAIRHGDVSAWGAVGISGGDLIEAVTVGDSGNIGILAGNGSVVRGCTVRRSGQAGIDVQEGCIVEGCTVTECGADGIQTDGNGVVRQCAANWNIGIGYKVGGGSAVSGCAAYNNSGGGFDLGVGTRLESSAATFNASFGVFAREGATVAKCEATLNRGVGISAANECVIESCSVNDNSLDGILVPLRCAVRNNHCYGNGASAGDGAGIHATAGGNRIEGNSCAASDRGIDVDAPLNFIARNICEGNSTNWTVVAGNFCLVVQAAPGGAINGNAGGAAPGSADPNANFTY